jgi:hypothetical protein
MSLLVTLTPEVSLHLHALTVPVAAEGDGWLNWATAKNSQTQSLFRGIAVTAAIMFVIWQGIMSKGAMARIIISLITAGILVWGVWHITDLSERTDNEFNSLPTLSRVHVPASAEAMGPTG